MKLDLKALSKIVAGESGDDVLSFLLSAGFYAPHLRSAEVERALQQAEAAGAAKAEAAAEQRRPYILVIGGAADENFTRLLWDIYQAYKSNEAPLYRQTAGFSPCRLWKARAFALLKQGGNRDICLIGYSRGGGAAVEIARLFQSRGKKIRLMITLDPVRLTPQQENICADKAQGFTQTGLHNIEEWRNIFIDYNSPETKILPSMLSANKIIKLSAPMMRIKEADENRQLAAKRGNEHAEARLMFSYFRARLAAL